MTEDYCPRVSSVQSTTSSDSSAPKQRRKRKWDQPAEFLVSAGVAVPGILPLRNMGSLTSVSLPNAASSSGADLANSVAASSATIPPLFQVPFLHQLATAAVLKTNQPKIQDELIAREIVINDADSAVRYKLTKRQTQEEIQRCSGAVVITRGKYHPPNAPPDSEKPLYLHISAGAHLETTVERIKAVDLAAAMVEEMLKQASVTNGGKVVHPLSTCVYLGFEADPSLNIAARIRGPNDQYVNHIVNETGATVMLRGHGSGNSESSFDEEGQQPLHLFLSSNNPKSLESAKLLAENLLDTIGREFGASRVSSCKVYDAVLPCQQLLASVQSSEDEVTSTNSLAASVLSSAVNCTAIQPISSSIHSGVTAPLLQGTLSQLTGSSSRPSQLQMGCYPHSSLTTGTSYYGYGGIYPQATPLQQVALALRQSPSLTNSTAAPATTATSTSANFSEISSSEKERRKRKFQELPAASSGCAKTDQNSLQGPRFSKPDEPKTDLRERNLSTIPAPKKLVQSSINGMLPPPPRTIPPPPPPKFNSSAPAPIVSKKNVVDGSKEESIPDTLIKLMEYGDEDDEDDEMTEAPCESKSNGLAAPKPFWAV